MIHKLGILSLLCLLMTSCKTETFSQEKCETLSMEKFRGNPKSAHLFKKHCSGVSVIHTPEYCQKALNKFILTGSLEQTKKEFGEKIDLCFTKNDLKKFSK